MREVKEELSKLDELHGAEKCSVKSQDELHGVGWSDLPLRSYQLDGLNWLLSRYNRKHGCILGDEMGLGKTCQTIGLLVFLRNTQSSKGPDIIICPRSVLENWEREIHRFAPSLRVHCHVGEREERKEITTKLLAPDKAGKFTFDVVITTYELCMKDCSILGRIVWHILVVDEAHRLKNQHALLRQTLDEWDIHTRVVLTGTPIQNNLQELYSLLSFVAPSIFKLRYQEEFTERYSNSNGKTLISELHDILKPFLLRRVKNDVLQDLPQKSEVVLYHGLSALQRKLYKAILVKDTDVFDNGMSGWATTSLMNSLMQLRKCVNHPYLFDGVESEPFQLGEHLVESSHKLVLVDRLLLHLKTTGHKVLMFSQMTRMLDILQDYLGYRGYTYERLDGSMRGEERFLAVQNFNENEDTFVFLLSTKAGGQGLNLTAADTVIFIDSDFNPQNDLQAAARAHRIGQTRPVKVIRLVGKKTVEEIILHRAEEKLKLTEKVFEEGQFSLGISKLPFVDDKVKLQDILKYGVETILKGDENDVSSNFDFEGILGSSTDGKWQLDELKMERQLSNVNKVLEGDIEGPQSMYMFEGTDYSKEPSAGDQKAFEELVSAEKILLEEKTGAERVLRRNTTVAILGTFSEWHPKPRKQLTSEEKEERKKKRQEMAERRAQEVEEKETQLAKERRRRRQEHWKRNGYISCSIAADSEDEDEAYAADEFTDKNDTDVDRSIKYVSGDVTHPVDAGTVDKIIVHCTDDSGHWGQGGVFSAISMQSLHPRDYYELAGKMKDLVLGDCHLIPFHDDPGPGEGQVWVALVISQQRDRKNRLSGIKLAALNNGLHKIYKAAKKMNASVHLPRIGHDTPGFNWYGTERLIQKLLASRGIPVYIYYYPRRRQLKRKGSDSERRTGKKVSCPSRNSNNSSSSSSPDSPKPSTSSGITSLPDIFQGTMMYFWNFPTDDFKRYKRYVVAYNGDIQDQILESTTHVIVPSTDTPVQRLHCLMEEVESSAVIVSRQWLETSLSRRKYQPVGPYVI